MGQYYKPVALGTKQYVNSWNFDCGLKLMEHSWVGNPFVKFVESLIAKGGDWYGKPIVWAGDYAEPEPEPESDVYRNLYDLHKKEIKSKEGYKEKHYRYVINLTKKCFVDKSKVPDFDGWKIHPLPLLTCEGNGQGGGDYRGSDDNNLVGSWARDIVKVSKRKPTAKGYKEIMFDLVEN